MALTTLGLPGAPFHEPFHDPPRQAVRSVTSAERASPLGAADNRGRAQTARAHRTGPSTALWSARASARTTASSRNEDFLLTHMYAANGLLTHDLLTLSAITAGAFPIFLIGNQIADLVCAEGLAASGLRGYRMSRYGRSADCSCDRGRARHSGFIPGYLVTCCWEGVNHRVAGRPGGQRHDRPYPGRLVLVNPHPSSASCDTSRSPAPITPAAGGRAA
jgi:hypothetical protein